MKNAHPIISATASSPVGPDSTGLDEPAEPIIRLKLQKPLHWEWELTTSADALPVIQLLDKDGRLLVETTGKTAQRARGSFKEGLRTHEQFPTDERTSSKTEQTPPSSSTTSSSVSHVTAAPFQGNRNIDGFSSKFGTCNFAPRKSRSDVNVSEGRSRKRHSPAVKGSTMRTNGEGSVDGMTTGLKRYSAGDYLRQQIMDDLRTRSTIGKSPEEIAKDRCRKVKAYLRSQSETLLSLVREEEHDGDETVDHPETRTLGESSEGRRVRKSDTAERRAYLEEKEAKKEGNNKAKLYSRTRSAGIPSSVDSTRADKPNEGDRLVRRIKGDMNEEELANIKAFLREKIQRRMNMEQARSRSDVRAGVPEAVENVGIRKRYSDYSHGNDRRNYRTRKVRSETSIIRFDPEVLEREMLKSSKQLEKEKPTNGEGSPENPPLQRQSRNYRRSRSDALVEIAEPDDRSKSQLKRESSSLERRKLYRKTKSDVLLGQAAANAESAWDLGNPPRRIRSQENVERSWREFKERKRSERLRKESEREVPEEDFMSKPRWKDLQRDICSSRNCKVCQNLRNCVDPLPERSRRARRENEVAELSSSADTAAAKLSDETSSTSSSRPSTSLQENYLLVDEDEDADGCQSPIVAKIQVKDRGNDVGSVSAMNVNSPDFGYNSIPKSAFNDYRELYARSNVKKSDTFKIIDGSEELEERAEQSDSKINGDVSDSDLGYLNGVGTLANKSNEDITRDYFKRVYELLKRRQEEARKSADGSRELPSRDDSSSSNYVEEMQRERHRRRRKDKSPQDLKTECGWL